MLSKSLDNPQNNRTTFPVIISSRVLTVLVVVFVESMFFSGLLSAFFVMRKGRQIWNTAGSVPLPTAVGGFNALLLILSSVFLFFAAQSLKKEKGNQLSSPHLFRAISLGTGFFAFQVYSCVQLIQAGMTITSSVFGGCFYLLVAAHLVNVIIGLAFMVQTYSTLKSPLFEEKASAIRDSLNGLQIFWLFTTVMWLALYAEVYF